MILYFYYIKKRLKMLASMKNTKSNFFKKNITTKFEVVSIKGGFMTITAIGVHFYLFYHTNIKEYSLFTHPIGLMLVVIMEVGAIMTSFAKNIPYDISAIKNKQNY
ncbi:MAG: hypothetical protein ACFFHV_15795 [Promethearchaeota archaeon]